MQTSHMNASRLIFYETKFSREDSFLQVRKKRGSNSSFRHFYIEIVCNGNAYNCEGILVIQFLAGFHRQGIHQKRNRFLCMISALKGWVISVVSGNDQEVFSFMLDRKIIYEVTNYKQSREF